MLLNTQKQFVIKKSLSKLKIGLYKSTGRNFFGRITIFSKGPGLNNYKYRLVNYKYDLLQSGYVLKKELDRRRTAFLGLVLYGNGLLRYVLLPENLNQFNFIFGYFGGLASNKALLPGNWTQLNLFPIGSYVFNIEKYLFSGGIYARAAGSWAQLISKHDTKIVLKLKSGLKVVLHSFVNASLGVVSHLNWKSYKFKNAGEKRRLGFKPQVRGVAMNPCDHPHGGGEGKKSKSPVPRTPWGKYTVRTKTRNTIKILKKKHKMKKIEYYL